VDKLCARLRVTRQHFHRRGMRPLRKW
jgi:hypothetical protein